MTAWIAALLLLVGSGFMLVAAVGVARFPDLIIRMHAATKAGSVGVGLMVGGVAIHFGQADVTTEAVLVAGFFLLTAPVAAHLIARAAHVSGVPLWDGTIVDEMRPRLERPPEPDADGAKGAPPSAE